jgi:hypothetical protein
MLRRKGQVWNAGRVVGQRVDEPLQTLDLAGRHSKRKTKTGSAERAPTFALAASRAGVKTSAILAIQR